MRVCMRWRVMAVAAVEFMTIRVAVRRMSPAAAVLIVRRDMLQAATVWGVAHLKSVVRLPQSRMPLPHLTMIQRIVVSVNGT